MLMPAMVCIITLWKPIAALPEIVELNIGHAIMARAMFDGLGKAVSDMRALMQEARLQGLIELGQ